MDRETITQETQWRRLRLRLSMGLQAIRTNDGRRKIFMIYAVLYGLLIIFRKPLFGIIDDDPLSSFSLPLVNLSVGLWSVLGTILVIILLGLPKGATSMRNALFRAGIMNKAGEAPILVGKYPDVQQSNVTVLEWDGMGIPRAEWEDKRTRIEAALNLYIVKIADGADLHQILLHTIPATDGLPGFIEWQLENLSQDDFVLVVGRGLRGPVTVNLAYIPHILIGGSTGSGKSILLKNLLMQAYQKGAEVYISDFKGGVDFPRPWHEKCHMCFDEENLYALLSMLVEILESRKIFFKTADVPNLAAYNRKTGEDLPRYIYACDELAEVLDKTGLSKEQKELVCKIESQLSILARQGRAFGIHLILATQRPDATILSGQIRNNIDCRICGRADNVLSQIILDSTDAADQIPKDAQGRFLLHDGTLIQGYWFDDTKL